MFNFGKKRTDEDVNLENEEVVEVKAKKNKVFPKILIGAGLLAAGIFTGKLLKKRNDNINEMQDSDGDDFDSDEDFDNVSEES